MLYYIYKIENLVNGKKYIGLTNNIQRRRARHFTDLKCDRHDNSFLLKEYNIYGKENFDFNIEFSGDMSSEEISQKEIEYIKKHDSYRNGYNQNEGGNFGPSNGGTHLTQSDIFNILSALEFMSRPGLILSNMFGVSKTTISRIKHGENHLLCKNEYENLPLEVRQEIYNNFCESTNFYKDKVNTTILPTKRRLTKEQVFCIYVNDEEKILPKTHLAKAYGLSSSYSITDILRGGSYKDYALEYKDITEEERKNLVSILRNLYLQTH